MPLLGRFLGEGTGRRVYVHGNDSTLVVKVAKGGYEELNREEAHAWGLAQQGCSVEWFAPVVEVDPDGCWLVMVRTQPVTKKEHYPSQIPRLFVDVNYCNYAWLGGRLVCHDYHNIQLAKGNGLKRAKWVEP